MKNKNEEQMDTSHFFLDGSPKNEMGFFDRHQVQRLHVDEFEMAIFFLSQKKDEQMVDILRPTWFFHEEQKDITLGKIREFFTPKAIVKLEKDGYLKIN